VFHFIDCEADATARTGTQVKTRSYGQLGGAGYEFLLKADMPGHAERIAAEPPSTRWPNRSSAGSRISCCCLASWLDHPRNRRARTEVDRIAGYEAITPGTSFVKISDLGKLKYGSKHFNVTADRTFRPAWRPWASTTTA